MEAKVDLLKPRYRIIAALVISVALHALLFLPTDKRDDSISVRSILHARLDTTNTELIQQAQTGQIQDAVEEVLVSDSSPNEQTEQSQQQTVSSAQEAKPPSAEEVVHSDQKTDKKVRNPTELQDINPSPEVEEPVEEKDEVEAVAQPKQEAADAHKQQISQAQVEAFSGSDDPTYTSHLKILTQYLAQRLSAKDDLSGTVRLKIKIQYGSIATSVKVAVSSGNPALDDWAVKAALNANPYPKTPKQLGDTFEFSPTLKLGDSPQ